MIILGIETSCDDTAVAVLNEKGKILSNVLSSQDEFHRDFGGIVPEIASRKHAELIGYVLKEALNLSSKTLKDIDIVSVTYGPGLVGSLLVGVEAAKAISFSLNIPLVGVNHLEGHIYSLFLEDSPLYQTSNPFPLLILIVSGGHTELVLMKQHLSYQLIGKTRDDAVGEALDKFARALGYSYPGGPAIERLGSKGDPHFYRFPRLNFKGSPYEFSYSGLKTAGIYYLNQHKNEIEKHISDIAASFEEALTDILVQRTLRAAKDFNVKAIGVVGGVSANKRLREKFAKKSAMDVYFPGPNFSMDNAAMIAMAGAMRYKAGQTSDLRLDAVSRLKLA